MSKTDLSRRSGVSLATLHRILSGNPAEVSFANVEKVARALGVVLRPDEVESPQTYREREAEKKARKLVQKTQGTMALESQCVSAQTVEDEIRRLTHALLAGSHRRLWGR